MHSLLKGQSSPGLPFATAPTTKVSCDRSTAYVPFPLDILVQVHQLPFVGGAYDFPIRAEKIQRLHVVHLQEHLAFEGD